VVRPSDAQRSLTLRILHVVHGFPPDAIGGTELHVRDLAEAQANDHDVAVFTRVRRPDAPDLVLVPLAQVGNLQVLGFNHLDRAGTSFLERTRFAPAEAAFAGAWEQFRPDVVHVHHLSGLSAGILEISAARGARVVLTVHDHALACPRGQRIRLDLDPCPVLDRDRCVKCVSPAWIEAARSPRRAKALVGLFRSGEGRRLFAERDAHLKQTLDRVSAFVAPSRSAADLFVEFHPAARPRMHVVPHGIRSHGAWLPSPPGNPFRVGYFGALLPSKGVLMLADVAARLSDLPVRIVMNGAGSASTMAEIRKRGRGGVDVPGPYRPEQLSERMSAVHAVAVPSLWPETFSIAVREAWAHRRPVLASETGGLVEAAGPSRNRIGLVSPGDVDAWVLAIGRLATDRAWYDRLAGPHEPEPFATMLAAIMACYTADS
jgi:glycosyltransferase involved in cell wall biosynthesis